jgi:hypothetical protein
MKTAVGLTDPLCAGGSFPATPPASHAQASSAPDNFVCLSVAGIWIDLPSRAYVDLDCELRTSTHVDRSSSRSAGSPDWVSTRRIRAQASMTCVRPWASINSLSSSASSMGMNGRDPARASTCANASATGQRQHCTCAVSRRNRRNAATRRQPSMSTRPRSAGSPTATHATFRLDRIGQALHGQRIADARGGETQLQAVQIELHRRPPSYRAARSSLQAALSG